MTQIYSTAHLLQFIYRETSLAKTAAIQKAIIKDAALQTEYNRLLSGISMLTAPACSAKNSVTAKIMSYSQITAE